jgi:hypothetical protein
MTSEERFEKIERDLAAAAALSLRNEQGIQGLQAVLQANAAAQQANIAALADAAKLLGERVTEYVSASDTRMRQMEANLDALIRIITAEHSNGQGKLGE